MFNEEVRVSESLDPLIEFISRQPAGSQLIFVDDGSSDRTVEVVRSRTQDLDPAMVTVLCREHAGKGASVRAGLLHATTTMAAFCDVDLATPLHEVERLVSIAHVGSSLAVGSRAAADADVRDHESLRREIAGKAFNLLVRSYLCGGVVDTQCGAKAAPTEAWQAILGSSREDGFAWDVEIIALALRMNIPVVEVGVEWHHDERTRVRVLHDGLAMVFSVPRIALHVRHAKKSGLARAAKHTPENSGHLL
jgi:dolichyl-phosphate beta-glucosyltransferase